MESTKLFIPTKMKVGFQERKDTYTGQLAYVIYFDSKGVLRKATSWESWRDKAIEPIEFDNIPTEGFVLNKGVGGARQSYGWNARNEYIRVYDPRNFEFEISVENLLFILRECDCSRGKGLEGKFVYAFDGKNLILLPESSADYQESQKFTGLQKTTVKVREMIPGATYLTKRNEQVIFVGRFDFYDNFTYDSGPATHKVNKFIFWNREKFLFLSGLGSISVIYSETIVPDYSELVDKYYKSINGSAIKCFHKGPKVKKYYLEETVNPNAFVLFDYRDSWGCSHKRIFTLENGQVCMAQHDDGRGWRYGYNQKPPAIDESKYPYNLYAEFESGSVYLLNYEGGWLRQEEAPNFTKQGEQENG